MAPYYCISVFTLKIVVRKKFPSSLLGSPDEFPVSLNLCCLTSNNFHRLEQEVIRFISTQNGFVNEEKTEAMALI